MLETLWLKDRYGPHGDYFKGLIQIAGAFVHLHKARPGPGASLLRSARVHLQKYPQHYLRWPVALGVAMIDGWLRELPQGQSLARTTITLPLPSVEGVA